MFFSRGRKTNFWSNIDFSISNEFRFALGKFASFYRFNALNSNISQTSNGVTSLKVNFVHAPPPPPCLSCAFTCH